MADKETTNAPTRKRVFRGHNEGFRTVTSFEDIDKQEEELQRMVSQIRSTSTKNPTEICSLISERDGHSE
jgi:hypothetical protein